MNAWVVPMTWALVMALFVPLGACNGGDDGGGSGGSGGSGATDGGGTGASGGSTGSGFSCDKPSEFACFQLAIPQGNPGWQAAADKCVADGGTPGTACPTANVIAQCNGAPQTFYYTGYASLSKAESVCTGLGGTWITP